MTDAGKCEECGQEREDRYGHLCRVSDLPRAKAVDGRYSIRETPGYGRGLWSSYVNEDGTIVAYFIGCTWGADRDALSTAIDAAEEEMRCMLADEGILFSLDAEGQVRIG